MLYPEKASMVTCCLFPRLAERLDEMGLMISFKPESWPRAAGGLAKTDGEMVGDPPAQSRANQENYSARKDKQAKNTVP